jgi:hypothetical protein
MLTGISGFPVPTALVAARLGGEGGGPDPGFTPSWDRAPVTTLGVGEHAVFDPRRSPGGCLRFRAVAAGGGVPVARGLHPSNMNWLILASRCCASGES